MTYSLVTGFVAIWLPILFVQYVKNIFYEKNKTLGILKILFILSIILILYTRFLSYPLNLFYIIVSFVFTIVLAMRDFLMK